jgi:hypothetical protein
MQDHGARAAQPPAGGDPNVRRDVGGWISGPMLDEPLPEPPVHPLPPGSTPLRELLAAITAALTLPGPATERDEVTYLRIHRDRARLVLFTTIAIPADVHSAVLDEVGRYEQWQQVTDWERQQFSGAVELAPVRDTLACHVTEQRPW